MKIVIDTENKSLTEEIDDQQTQIGLYSKRAFETISQLWLKIGWNEKYSYTFTWLGIPIIQNPADIIRAQEVVYRLKPDIIIETGVAHGGSLVFYASLCKAMGKGRVIGVDIKIRPNNRKAIETHKLTQYITLIEGSSTEPAVVRQVKSLVKTDEKVLLFFDSDHSKKHVLAELEAYHNLVTVGSYLVVTDGIMKDLHDVPRGRQEWTWDNPAAAAAEFVKTHPEFVIEPPGWPFNESELNKDVTYWPRAWVRKIR